MDFVCLTDFLVVIGYTLLCFVLFICLWLIEEIISNWYKKGIVVWIWCDHQWAKINHWSKLPSHFPWLPIWIFGWNVFPWFFQFCLILERNFKSKARRNTKNEMIAFETYHRTRKLNLSYIRNCSEVKSRN